MYYLREGKEKELKNGRTVVSLANKLEVDTKTLYSIFKNKKCKKVLAMALISVADGTPLNDVQMEERLNHYFDKK